MLNRRDFLSSTILLVSVAAARRARASVSRPQIAFTFDDPKTQKVGTLGWQEVNDRMLRTLARYRIKSVLFVCGMRIDSDAGHELVGAWDRYGHLIANHSYSHLDLDEVAPQAFEADILKNEHLIASCHNLARLFRYPYFKEGNTADKRDGVRMFLQERGYRIGRATIDSSDWAISARLEKRLAESPSANAVGYRDFFLQHIWERAQYYQGLAQQVWASPVRHTLLLHHNALNALFLDALISMFVRKGWQPVDAEYAYRDLIYEQQPKSLPAGESLIWGLAKETGRFDSQLRYPAEDDVYENPKMDSLML
jgi:peptidoglycan-N-acetylglucosamine deacetylase